MCKGDLENEFMCLGNLENLNTFDDIHSVALQLK